MKKALQIPSFAGPESISETAVGRSPGEACASGFRDRFAERRILDRSSPSGRRTSLFQCSFGSVRLGGCCCLCRRLGQRPGDELDPFRREPIEAATDLAPGV
jgi:hypothetical protein